VHRLMEENSVMQYSCPTCGSQNTQRLSTAYMSGVSQFSAVTSGVGWAGAPVFGSGWTSGTSQTQLSKIAAPPTKKSYRNGLFLLFLAPFIGPAPFALLERISGVTPVYEHLAVVFGILLEIVALVWLVSTFTFNKTVWPKLCRQWQLHFVCLRCGQIFVSG
jgi:DNA-directed RNA polymerase subunit RPC12/RpoP